MGLEATCKASLVDQVSSGKAHCGDGEIDFRGDFRFRWKWDELSAVESEGGVLYLTRNGEKAELHLGELSDKWCHAIRNPKSRMDKFGLKGGHRYQLWGEFDDAFPAEAAATAGVTPADDGPLDAVFVRLHDEEDLPRLLEAKAAIVPNGMIWTVWIKGRKEFGDTKIRAFGLENGLVDVKIASVSQTLTSMKFVIPLSKR